MILVGVAGCSKGSRSSASHTEAGRLATATDPHTGFELAATSYKPSATSALGTVVGIVDYGVLPAIDEATHECETGTQTPAHSRAALVWIDGLESGKELPIEKRADLSSQDCGLDPSIVATTVGSTVNVYNDDAALHRLVFTGPPVDGSVTMPFFNIGQVVASERLTKRVGFVDVSCALHPWTHATIAVFDQPYFAVTDDHGRFSLDSIPEGSYTLMVWRPDLDKPIERRIQVSAQHTTNLTIGGPNAATAVSQRQIEVEEAPRGTKRSSTIDAKSRAR